MRIGAEVAGYRVAKRLGEGAFGAVYMAQSLSADGAAGTDSVHVAVKEIPMSAMDSAEVLREMLLMRHFRSCPHIIQLFGVVHGDPTLLVLELLDIDLERWLDTTQQRIELRQVRLLAYQMLGALHWIHSAGVVHRDIKRPNMLLHCNWLLKICDLGAAKVEGDDDSKDCRIGSYTQRAPELLVGTSPYSPATDVWGIGVVFQYLLSRLHGGHILIDEDCPDYEAPIVLGHFERAYGTPPREAVERLAADPSNADLAAVPSALLRGIPDTGYSDWQEIKEYATEIRRRRSLADATEPVRPANWQELWPGVDRDAAGLLTALLRFDPLQRITTAAALQHKFFTRAVDFLKEVELMGVRVDLAAEAQPFRCPTDPDGCAAEVRKIAAEMHEEKRHQGFYADRKRATGLMMMSPLVVHPDVSRARRTICRNVGGIRRKHQLLRRPMRADSFSPSAEAAMPRCMTIGMDMATLAEAGGTPFGGTPHWGFENSPDSGRSSPEADFALPPGSYKGGPSPLRPSSGFPVRSASLTLLTPEIAASYGSYSWLPKSSVYESPPHEVRQRKELTAHPAVCLAAACAAGSALAALHGIGVSTAEAALADGQKLGVRWSNEGAPAGWVFADRVAPGGVGDKAGIRVGQRLVAVNGHRVSCEADVHELVELLHHQAGRLLLSPPTDAAGRARARELRSLPHGHGEAEREGAMPPPSTPEDRMDRRFSESATTPTTLPCGTPQFDGPLTAAVAASVS
eukprot:TRINITY_DN60135_c0_g1_i1.p1 TRINITY_DN60135_c0_g1~~TRINITY_DN60135_c0_g1_i1.p1  ORF type:complete len:743 (+),score=223.84 TRINITY_DN60135_c0_g1_i1:177-2405(+)